MRSFEYLPAPWVGHDPAFPSDWVEGWTQGGHRGGRARVTALAELHARLAPFGVTGAAIVGGAWLLAESSRPELWRTGPWTPGPDPTATLHAVGAGTMAEGWIEQTVDAFLADPQCLRPSEGPCLYATEGGVLFDPSLMNRRDALVLLALDDTGSATTRELVAHRSTWWVALIIAGAIRADAFWTGWDDLVARVVSGVARPWANPSDRPVNPQEVTLRVAEMADEWAGWTAEAFRVAAVGIFMPDPDDEYVYCLGRAGMGRHAADPRLVDHDPGVVTGFGLTAAWAVAPAWDPSGRPLVVRDLERRDALRDRYRDLGFDPDEIAADEPRSNGPFLSERFMSADTRAAAADGPWVFTTQRLPPSLSPSGRNLLVRMQGCTVPLMSAAGAERSQTNRDRRARVAMVAQRVHEELVGAFEDGLNLWRDGLRTELLRELAGRSGAASLCRTLAAWTSARTVSLWSLEDNGLALVAWSLASAPPSLATDPRDHLDSRELRLLSAPLYPRRTDIGTEGFCGWHSFNDARGGPAENTGTLPLVRDRRTIGLLRIDGAMSLFAGHIARGSEHGALHQHRPMVVPFHLRAALEEAAMLLALALDAPRRAAGVPDWKRFVREVVGGQRDADPARSLLEALYRRAPTHAAAAAECGVHRNTFRHHLRQLTGVLGPLPWR